MLHAFHEKMFPTVSFSWNNTGLSIETMALDKSFAGRLEIHREAFQDFEQSKPGMLSFFSERFSNVLGPALIGHAVNVGIQTRWRFLEDRAQVSVVVDGFGEFNRTLGHVPDAVTLPSARPRFVGASRFETDVPHLLRDIHNATAWAETLLVRFNREGVVFLDPRSAENWFRPQAIVATSAAETLLDRASLDYATKIAEHTSPTKAEMAIIDHGFGLIAYSYPNARLEYYIPTLVLPE